MEGLSRAVLKLTVVLLTLTMMTAGGRSPCPSLDEEGEEMNMDIDKAVHQSDVVVLGKVMSRVPFSEEGQVSSDKRYSVQMTVFCIYKGHNVPATITISNAGDGADPCPDHQMELGEMYLSYLHKIHDVFKPAFPHQPEYYKDEMFSVCGLNISRPPGAPMKNGDVEVTCEDDRDYDEPCVPYTPEPGDSSHGGKSGNQPGETGKVEGDGEEGPKGRGSSATSCLCVWCVAVLLCTVICTLLS